MFDLRDLYLLTELSQHRHFGRAAAACGISQPAFSARIRNLEDRLGAPIVRRGNRFQGLTAKGEAIVAHARGILEGVRSLEEEVRSTDGEVAGALTLACVPTAAAIAARLTGYLYQRHPRVSVRIDTATSLTIQMWIDEGRIDAGITYGDGISSDLLDIQPLYTERYVLVCPSGLAPRETGTATWLEAATLPLSLLEPGMLNRRILDATFASVGANPKVISETNALTTALVLARDGHAATVIPASLLDTLGAPPETVVLNLTEPDVEKPITLVTSSRGPTLPTLAALKAVAADFRDNQ